MLHWNSFKEKKPPYETNLEVMDLSGKTQVASLIYLDDINQFVWKHDGTYGLFDVDYHPYWREMNRKRYFLHKALSGFNKTKDSIKSILLPSKKHWVVTCVTEDSEIFLQDMFNSYEEAYENMTKYYNKIINDLGSAVHETHLFPESATIIYDDDPCVFEFKITCIEK